MKKLVTVAGLAALTLVATGAQAADQGSPSNSQNMVAQGNWLGSFAGSVQSTRVSGGSSTTTSNSSLTGGYMVTNNIGIGLKAAYSSVSSFDNFTGFVSARYYLNPQPTQTLIPFIGPFVGYNKATGGSTISMYGVNAGVEYFVARNVSVTPNVNYFHSTGGGVTSNTYSFSIGFTFWFAGK